MLEERPIGGGGNRVAPSSLTVRRSLALGDVLCATVVADKLVARGLTVEFQSHPAGHPILRRCKNVKSFTEPRGQPTVNLDGAYETDPHRVSKTFHRMFIDRANQQLSHLGINLGDPTNCRPRLTVTDAERETARARFMEHPRPWVFICPRSESYPHRQVHDGTWLEIAQRVKGTKFWLGLHPAPPGIVDLKVRYLDNLIVWLSAADLLITVDTGPMHIGAALGIPIVAISQSSSPDLHLNNQNDFVSVKTDLECLNCQKNLCPKNAIMPPCFEPDTMVLCYTGHKRIAEITAGERVWSGTHWRRVTQVMETPYTGQGVEIITVYGKGNPIRTTTEHPFWVRQKGWVQAGDLKTGDYLKLALPFGPEGAYFTHSKTGKPILENEDDWWTVGYFLGDGWVSGKRVSFAISKKDEGRILPKILKSFRVSRKAGGTETCSTFEARNKTWSEVFSELGHKAHGKKLPSWVIDARESYLRALVKGYLDSDGSRCGKELHFTSTSRSLLLGFQLVFWKLGYTASVTYCKRPPRCVIQGRTVNQRSTYHLTAVPQRMIDKRQIRWTRKFWVNRKHLYVRVRELKACVLGPLVYNLTVEKDHTYTANNIYNHNCQQVDVDGIVAWSNARLRGMESESVAAIIPIYQPDTGTFYQCVGRVEPQVDEIIVTAEGLSIFPKPLLAHPRVKYVQTRETQIGYGRNVNFGARFSNSKYLLLLNDDVFLEPDAVSKMKAAMRPDVGMVCHLLRLPSGKIYPVAMGRRPGDRDWHHIDHGAWHPSITEVTELENCCGASVLVRREAFYQIGGFDEDFFLYAEDNDFALRIRQAGWKILYLPHVSGVHVNGASTSKVPLTQQQMIQRSGQLFHSKWDSYLRHNVNRVPGTFDYV